MSQAEVRHLQGVPQDHSRAVRIQTNLLAHHERQLIQWLCARAPKSLTPDQLTAIGVFGAFLIFLAYLASRIDPVFLLFAIFGYIINWYGDSLDGSLARYRHIERIRFGYFLDHSADAFSIMLILLGLGLSGFVKLDVALFVLLGYLLMCIHVFLAVYVTGQFRLTYLAVGPTELRLGLVVLTGLMFFDHAKKYFFGLTIVDLVLSANAVLLIGLFLYRTVFTLQELRKAEIALESRPDMKSSRTKTNVESPISDLYVADDFSHNLARNSSILAK